MVHRYPCYVAITVDRLSPSMIEIFMCTYVKMQFSSAFRPCYWYKFKTYNISGGSKGDARDAPSGPNSFNFMQLLGKLYAGAPPEGLTPHLEEILDPPQVFWTLLACMPACVGNYIQKHRILKISIAIFLSRFLKIYNSS